MEATGVARLAAHCGAGKHVRFVFTLSINIDAFKHRQQLAIQAAPSRCCQQQQKQIHQHCYRFEQFKEYHSHVWTKAQSVTP